MVVNVNFREDIIMINIIFIFLSQLKFTNVGDILKKFKEKNSFLKIESVSIYLSIVLFFPISP